MTSPPRTTLRSLLLLLAVVVLAACGEPSTAIGDGAGDGPSSPPEATPTATATPIPVEPDGGIGGPTPPGDGTAPDFGVSSETDSLVLPPVSYCWSDESAGTGICADGQPDPAQHTITAQEQLVVTYAEGTLLASATPPGTDPAVSGDGDRLPVVVENPGISLVDVSGLEPGPHEVRLSWTGEQGDATASLTVTIDRPQARQ